MSNTRAPRRPKFSILAVCGVLGATVLASGASWPRQGSDVKQIIQGVVDKPLPGQMLRLDLIGVAVR